MRNDRFVVGASRGVRPFRIDQVKDALDVSAGFDRWFDGLVETDRVQRFGFVCIKLEGGDARIGLAAASPQTKTEEDNIYHDFSQSFRRKQSPFAQFTYKLIYKSANKNT